MNGRDGLLDPGGPWKFRARRVIGLGVSAFDAADLHRIFSWRCGGVVSLNGKHGLAHVVLTGRLGNPKSLPDDVLKVWIHVGMRAQAVPKEKPRTAVSAPV